ncbi:hypothetical protein F5B22DRAFT_615704 [Xylaria bambusicola]|uniref:uncharacterized protein n=1 Tax=Xylaria bambusicola TaxID=326684 RepID=UPI0020081749|nr:uncharacterized protein F5B22DRAFT_615704 [Xylaria bambusicola]KAI0509708.1 hypothetical protein F5B22DRAFT_615704 [Xylaria bambusicola]
MLFFFFLAAYLLWTLVLAFFILCNFGLLLKTVRWTLTLYLLGSAILAAEVLREGLFVNGENKLHWDIRVAWTAWIVFVVGSVIDWRFLLPASALPLWFLSYPEARTLLNYGLVRLGWIEIVHSPLTWAVGQARIMGLGDRTHVVAVKGLGKSVSSVLMPALRAVSSTIEWALWTTEQELAKLRPTHAWSWIPGARR